MSTAEQRMALSRNDEELVRSLTDLQTMSREFGLAMEGSARAISDSIAMLARLHFDE